MRKPLLTVLALCAIFALSCHTVTTALPAPGWPGGPVVIQGEGFGAQQGAGRVLYDGEELAVTSWSDGQIMATLPAAKADGSYTLTVETRFDSVEVAHEVEAPPEDMVVVPAGPFAMGAGTGPASEQPVHTVYLDAFHIDETEVTVGDYAACVGDGACVAPYTFGYCNWGVTGRQDHPVNCVTWEHATAFCGWAGKRLATEAEWEKAARGTDQRTYPWGDQGASCAFAVMNEVPGTFATAGCYTQATFPVGSKPAGISPYGALDMAGNLWEWTADWLDVGYYSVSPPSNPTGPASGTYRVVRGSSWIGNGPDLRTTYRAGYQPHETNDDVGFRCAADR